MIRVDMSEYQDGRSSVDKLIGMPRGIVGSERGGVLTNQLKDNPYCVVLLDEVEKASPNTAEPVPPGVRRGLADRRPRQARVSERRDRHHDVEHRRRAFPEADEPARASGQSSVGVEQVQGEVMRELERRFPPEFRNRIDEIVAVRAAHARRGARDRAGTTCEQVTAHAGEGRQDDHGRRRGARARGDEAATAWRFGARFLKRFIDEHIKLPISARWKEGSHFEVTALDGALVAEPAPAKDAVGRRLALEVA